MSRHTDASTSHDKVVLVNHPTGSLDDFILVVGDDLDSFPTGAE